MAELLDDRSAAGGEPDAHNEVFEFPASSAQERLWFLHQFDPGSAAYNMPAALRLQGALDTDALWQSLLAVVRRHETLRTTFDNVDGQPMQVCATTAAFKPELVDLRSLPPAQREAQVLHLAREEARRPFNLQRGPLLRATLLRLEEREHVLLFTMHHIISDLWSMGVLVREVAALYASFSGGKPVVLPELPIQYADYALFQREWLQSAEMAHHLAYWHKHLTPLPRVLVLPSDRPRPPAPSFRGAVYPFRLPANLTRALRGLSEREGVTLFMTLLAAFNVLLYRYTGQADVVVGSPIANRNNPELEGLIGFFANTLALRNDLSGMPSFRELLQGVAGVALDAFEHQEVPFEMLVEKLQPERDLSGTPLVQVMFALQNTPLTPLELAGVTLLPLELDDQTAAFDLTLFLEEREETLWGRFQYSMDLFDEATVARMAGHFETLLAGIANDPRFSIAELPLLTEAEQHLLADWNATATNYPHEHAVHELFRMQAMSTPDALAIIGAEEHRTYGTLERSANQLAHHLRRVGVSPKTNVGIFMELVPDRVLAQLAVLKAGGAYVLLDADLPPERVALLSEDAGISVFLTQERLLRRLPAQVTPVVCMDSDLHAIEAEETTPPLVAGLTSGDPACVHYTFDHAGSPLGTIVPHRSLVRLALSNGCAQLSPADCVGLVAGHTLGAAAFETWGALLNGARLVIMGEETAGSPWAFSRAVREHGVTTLLLTTALFQQIVRAVPDAFADCRCVMLGGGFCHPQTISRVLQHGKPEQLLTVYGAPETGMIAASIPVEGVTEGTRTLIGRPAANARCCVLDRYLQPVPVGVPGDLYVGGDGLASGYLNRPELTAERFVESSPPGGPGLYKTGDIVKYRPDGTLEFIEGSAGNQGKSRGVRLADVQAALAEHPGVGEALAMTREDDSGTRRVVAYVVPVPDVGIAVDELRSYMQQRIAEHMVPAAFVLLDAFPRNAAGKVDRRSLPVPEVAGSAQQEHVAPRTPSEEALLAIWAELLGRPPLQVSVTHSFFKLGGHSLLATRVMARLRETCRVDLPLRTLFEAPTIAELAAHIDAARRSDGQSHKPPLTPSPRDEALPLSFAQQRLWFIDQWQPGTATYNIPVALRLSGHLSVPVLEQVFTEIVRRHEVLRATFTTVAGDPVQIIHPPTPFQLPLADLQHLPAEEREREVRQLAVAEAQSPFDLAVGPVFRAALVRLSVTEHVLLINMHHIVSDGWSVGVLAAEVAALYEAYAAGKGSPLSKLGVQYADYAAWQRQWLQGDVLKAQLGYWKQQLAGAPALLELPTDRPRPPVQTFAGAELTFELPGTLRDRLKRLGEQEGATLFMTLLSAFQVLLSRYSGQTDIAVGTPIAGRTEVETEPLIGFFVNTMVLRTKVSDSLTFRNLLRQVRETAMGAYMHQDAPFEKLVEELQPERSSSYTPLFQVMFALQNAPMGAMEVPGLRLSPLAVENATSRFDMTLSMTESDQGLAGYVEYSTDLFDRATIIRLVGHFGMLLEAGVDNPDTPVAVLPLLTEAERQQVLIGWNDTAVDYPQERLVHQLVETEAARNPGAVAVVSGDQRLTYGELNSRANQLAHFLIRQGLGPEAPVAICMERTPEMIVGLLAILKAGCAYLPMDPVYPNERLAFMTQDASAAVVLTQLSLTERLQATGVRLICLDTDWADLLVGHSTENPVSSVAAGDLAYIIYTSGSTGQPKGVQVEHGSLLNLLFWHQRVYHVTAADRGTHLAGPAFDASVWEVWPYLTMGASLYLPDEEVRLSPVKLRDWLVANAITLTFLPTPLAESVLMLEWPAKPALRAMLTGGDKLHRYAPEHLGFALVNHYGPTENTVVATAGVVPVAGTAGTAPHIGRPIANTQVYVLDGHMQPVPVGVPGELSIGGRSVARDYLNRPELTAERFVTNPFGEGRLYRTGDLVRYMPDGNIEYLGRMDHQVKIRGFRIELGEIEALLLQHEAVREAVVIDREDASGNKRLVAYLVVSSALALSDLRESLKAKLPEYMVPAAFVLLNALPKTPNGKVDRLALPVPQAADLAVSGERVAPRTPTEELLADVWAEVVGHKQFGVYDNFFALGGHSLVATRVVARLREACGVELPLRTLFEAPTIAELAAHIDAARRSDGQSDKPPLTPAPRDGALPLSFAQQRLWLIDQWQPGTATYNMPVALRLSGHLSVPVLEQVFTEIVRRHEVLRTTLTMVDGDPMQVIHPPTPFQLAFADLQHLPAEEREREARRLAGAEAQTPFDLAAGPVFRAALVRLSVAEHVLLMNMHHIVSDGWSVGVLAAEMAALYEAFAAGKGSPLSELGVQYADYAAWQRQWLQGDVLQAQLGYWKQQLAGAPALLELPTDRPRPAVQTFAGAELTFELPGTLRDRLKGLGEQEGATLFMTLLSAFQVLLSRYSGQTDIAVGTPIAGRTEVETEPLIGFFVNTMVLRTKVSDSLTFRNLLRQVRETAMGAYMHQDAPFEKLVEELQPERSSSYTPLFQVMFALQNAPMGAMEVPGLRLSPLAVENATSRFDMTLSMTESDQGLVGHMEYSTDLFDRASIIRLVGHFRTLLEAAANHPDRPVSVLPLLTEAERQQVLIGWNDTAVDYPKERLVHQLVASEAARNPGAVAVVFGDRILTYRELDRKANALAHRLQAVGVGAGRLVGIMAERSPEMIVGLLAILKAGGGYLPLDPGYPAERLSHMLTDAAPPVLLAQPLVAHRLPGTDIPTLELCIDEERDDAPVSTGDPESPAYINYTSGSTGLPKGVLVPHRGVVRLVSSNNWIEYRSDDIFFQFSPIAFDAATFEIWGSLCNGARLVLMTPGVSATSELGRVIRGQRITVLWLTAGLFHLMVEEQLEALRGVRCLLAGGDVLSADHVNRVLCELPGTQMINGYGPTENTTFTTCHVMVPGAKVGPSVPIGRPVSNSTGYVLDRNLQPCPVGVPGELYTGGDGLALGYLNRPELTDDRFVPNPYGPGRLYKTGDLVKWRLDGTLEFLVRVDFQVKLRGFRVELGEVEAVLNSLPAVRESIVVADGTGLAKQLVAYVVPHRKEDGLAAQLRRELHSRVPTYMVPAHVELLDGFPLNAHGKVDRRALPVPSIAPAGEAESFEAPRTPAEELLAGIWSQVLGHRQFGVHHNFFGLGGHSLLAIRVISRVREVFGVEVPLRVLFDSPTVAGLASSLETAQRVEAPPLLPAAREGALQLSFAQQRLWFIDRLQPGNVTYSLPIAFRLSGSLSVSVLQQIFTEILRRHEALRTTFDVVDGEPVQVVHLAGPFPLPVMDLRQMPPGDREAEARELVAREADRPFDLAAGPLFRASLLQSGDEEYLLLINMHHIVSDGWSMSVLAHEMTALYKAFHLGEPSPLPELSVQYADYAAWQRQWLQGEVIGAQLAYWRKQLTGVAAILELPNDRPRPVVQSFRGASVTFSVPTPVRDSLKALSDREGATLFMVLLSAFKLLLFRYSGQTDITVGTPVAGRSRTEIEPLIGFFVNTLVLRSDLAGNPSFRDLLRRVRETAMGAYANQDVPFEKLVEELQPQRDLNRTPFFQVMFNMLNLPLATADLPGLVVRQVESESHTNKLDVNLSLEETADGLRGVIGYKTDLFDTETVVRMAGNFCNLLEHVAAEPERSILDLPLLTPSERQRVVEQFGRIPSVQTHGSSVSERFEEQVRRTPDAAAVIGEQRAMTYSDLNRRANQVAHYLRGLGVGPEVPVAVLLERSTNMLVALLGVLKAGGAYVPMDPAYPAELLGHMIGDSKAPVILTQASLAGALPATSGRTVCLDAGWDDIVSQPDTDPVHQVAPDNAAYIIYTSGSTGRPKGVVVQHRSVLNLSAALGQAVYAELPQRALRVSLNGPMAFDTSVKQLIQLLRGHALVVVPQEIRLDPAALISFLDRHQIDVLDCTPAQLRFLTTEGAWNKLTARPVHVLVGGEAIDESLWKVLAQSAPHRFFNVYGPTECTVDATCCSIHTMPDSPSLGRPIPGVQVYILDSRLQPVPIGASGELCIGGAGVARGYLGQSGLTAERFVPDPFSDVPGGRLYRTGDLARFRSDGTIVYLGRFDDQVKVRGYRVELGEIESVLRGHPGLHQAVVAFYQADGGDKRLAAYWVPVNGDAPSGADLRNYLRGRLPEHMVPSAFVQLAVLPLTHNGKVDRRALPLPERSHVAETSKYIAPRNLLEQTLAEIWCEVLGLERVGVHDNFFALGGHSLLAVRLMARIQQVCGRALPVTRLFQGATIEHLASGLLEQEPIAASESSLVLLQVGKSDQPPLFLIHPVGGTVFCYLELVRHLGPDRPVYGLQSRGLGGAEEPLRRVDDMAARYLPLIRAVQPHGPYLLAGWSMGGAVAFELATQLQTQGQKEITLILIDSVLTPASHDATPGDLIASFAANLGMQHPANAEPVPARDGLVSGEVLPWLLNEARSSGILPPYVGLDHVRRLWEIYVANREALYTYQPHVYDGPVVLIEAEGTAVPGLPAERGWAAWTRQPLVVQTVAGDHFSMFRSPNVAQLAKAVSLNLV